MEPPNAIKFFSGVGDAFHKIGSAIPGEIPSNAPTLKPSDQLKLGEEECCKSRPQQEAISAILVRIAY
jgi:hypothetical protein